MSQHHAVIAALFLALAPLGANAQPAEQTRSITIYAGDLNLASSTGRATLAARIGNAVGTICGFPHSAREAAAYATCSEQALGGAEKQAEALTAASGKVASRPTGTMPNSTAIVR
jgi:UrcA family protein